MIRHLPFPTARPLSAGLVPLVLVLSLIGCLDFSTGSKKDPPIIPPEPTPPVITTEPSDRAVLPGGTARFTVAASGEGLSYQWIRGANFVLAGQTSATLTLTDVSEVLDSMTYKCEVSNAQGTVTSVSARLLIDAPRAFMIDTGEAIFSVACTGCHGDRGERGRGPPLQNSDFHMANRTKTIEILLAGNSDSILVNGYWYPGGVMPEFGSSFTNMEIASLLTYIRVVLNDSNVVSCNPANPDPDGYPTCVKTARSPAEIASDSVSIREVRAIRTIIDPL